MTINLQIQKILLIDREADVFQAKRVGADGHLLKPLDKTNLKKYLLKTKII